MVDSDLNNDVLDAPTSPTTDGDAVEETILNFSTKQRVEKIVDDVLDELDEKAGLGGDGLTPDAKATAEMNRSDLKEMLEKERTSDRTKEVPVQLPATKAVPPLEPPGRFGAFHVALGLGVLCAFAALVYFFAG